MDNKILASVNGVNITDRDLNRVIAQYPQESRGYLTSEEGRKQLLNEVVYFELMYHKGKEMNFEELPEYKAQLEAMSKSLLSQITIQKLISDVKVSEDEVMEAYENNKDSYMQPPMVSAKHILVDTEEKANDIYNDVLSGSISFEDAAKQYSSCPSKEQGGNLGQFSRGMMVPEFENAAFSMKVGEISKPVKTQFGWHLIKLEGKSEAIENSFEEVRGQVTQQLMQQKQSELIAGIIEGLSKKYEVKYY